MAIEEQAFDFAWQQAVKDTVLNNAERVINKYPAKVCVWNVMPHSLFINCTIPALFAANISSQYRKEKN